MTTHVRAQIRAAVLARLAGVTSLGAANVLSTRVMPVGDARLPCLLVYVGDDTGEASEPFAIGGAVAYKQRRVLTLRMEAIVKAAEPLDDAMDAILLDVETLMASDPTFGGLCREGVFLSSEPRTDVDGENDKPVGRLVMDWACPYWVMTNAPGVAL
jgi:hypothetical protein